MFPNFEAQCFGKLQGGDQLFLLRVFVHAPLQAFHLAHGQTGECGGFGTANPNNQNLYNASYATTAWNNDRTLAITYTPVSTMLSVNIGGFSKPMTAFWYDPTTGNSTAINGSPFANRGSQSFTTPSMARTDGTYDWVLVLQ